MDCEKLKENIALYIDEELDEIEMKEVQQHIKQCEQCKNEFEQLLDVINDLKALPQIELPENFHNELMKRIKNESIEHTQEHNNKKFGFKAFCSRNWRMMSGLTAAACFVFVVYGFMTTGAGGAKSAPITENFTMNSTRVASAPADQNASDAKYGISSVKLDDVISETTAAAQATSDEAAPQGKMAASAVQNEVEALEKVETSKFDLDKKIIKTANISLSVYDFDNVMQKLKSVAEQSGGYVENSNSYINYTDPDSNTILKAGSITLKVPSELYDSVIASTSGLGTVTDNNEFIEDVTADYIDTQSLLKAKKLEEERLFAIMEKAETVEDLILLEQRLSTVRGDLEVYRGRINNWDRLVKFSTVIVTIQQEKQFIGVESSPVTLRARMKKSFVYSIDHIKNTSADIMVWGAEVFPVLCIVVLIVLFVMAIIKFLKKTKKQR